MVMHMSKIRMHYQDYIIELTRKASVCDRMFVETGHRDWLDTYNQLTEEISELKAQIKHMERYDETDHNQDSEK